MITFSKPNVNNIPLTIPGNKLTLLPQYRSTLRDGSSLTAWLDQALGTQVSQDMEAEYPSIISNGQVNDMVVDFNGSSSGLDVADNTVMNIPLTIIYAIKLDRVDVAQHIIVRDAGGAPTGTIYCGFTAGVGVIVQVRNASNVSHVTSASISVDTPSIIVARIANGSVISLSVNGNTPILGETVVDFSASTGTVGIGYRPSAASTHLDGWLGGVQCINRIISSEEETKIVRWYANRLGITIN